MMTNGWKKTFSELFEDNVYNDMIKAMWIFLFSFKCSSFILVVVHQINVVVFKQILNVYQNKYFI